ncbi:MAG: hypothetical protein H6Q67_1803 [Firmicutes bacterium]|nr:hypothetical protein [Bacillota bacterium]
MKAINICMDPHRISHTFLPKKGTIRLGDVTKKYSEDEVIWITAGNPDVGKKKICTAVIERLKVTTVDALTPEDMQLENPLADCATKIQEHLSTLYNTLVTPNDTITVITYYELAE